MIDKEAVAYFLEHARSSLILDKFMSYNESSPFNISYKRRRAQALLESKVVVGYEYVDYEGAYTADGLHEWLSAYVNTDAKLEYTDDGINLSWRLERPATEEELKEAQEYLDTYPEPDMNNPIQFAERFKK